MCKHAKNHQKFVSHNWNNVVAKMAIGVAKKEAKKVIQIAIVLNLLQQSCPMNPWNHSLTSLSFKKTTINIKMIVQTKQW